MTLQYSKTSLDCFYFSLQTEGKEAEKTEASTAPQTEKKLTNQFNYCERASQTYNNPYRVTDYLLLINGARLGCFHQQWRFSEGRCFQGLCFKGRCFQDQCKMTNHAGCIWAQYNLISQTAHRDFLIVMKLGILTLLIYDYNFYFDYQERETQTEPPPRANFSATANQVCIYLINLLINLLNLL